VTFCRPSPVLEDPLLAELKARVDDLKTSRRVYRVDHYYVNLDFELPALISHTRYYAGLLSHQSETGVWKGMLQISLNTVQDDAQALQRLEESE